MANIGIFSMLSCFVQDTPFDELKLDIIASLPLEIAVVILRLLSPRTLVSAILVCRRWLRIVRTDTVLRRRVRDELRRERLAYWNMVQEGCGNANEILSAEFLQQLKKQRPCQQRIQSKKELLRDHFVNKGKQPHKLFKGHQGQPIESSRMNHQVQQTNRTRQEQFSSIAPRNVPSKLGKVRSRRQHVERSNPIRPTCLRM